MEQKQLIYKKAISVSATNILFKSIDEQFLIIENFGKLLDSLTIPIQIMFSSNEFDIDDFKLKINNPTYVNFLKKQVKKKRITNKNFKIIVSNTNELILDTTIEVIKRYIRQCKLELGSIETIRETEYVPDEFTKEYARFGDYYTKSFFVKDWPYSCTYGWLDNIYNTNLNIDASMYIYPVEKCEALKYLEHKIAGNVSNAVIDDENDELGDEYDENILSGLRMREELIKNQGKFYFMSYYITVKAHSLSQLHKDCYIMETLLKGMGIKSFSCYLKHDDGYKSTQPLGFDILDKKYNFTTKPLKYFFPFITSNIVDKDGVFIGENLLSPGLIFLNPFSYNSALMFVLGKVGGGKTYLIQLLALRLLYMGVEIDIWDKTGLEYKNLLKLTKLPNLRVHTYATQKEYETEITRYISDMKSNLYTLTPRFLIIDEGWQYLNSAIITCGINEVALTGRKFYQGLCFITQQLEHLQDPSILAILRQASIKALMQMETNAARVVQKELGLTDNEVAFLISAYQEGILFAGSRHVQFKAIADDYEDQIITTDPVRRAKNLGGSNHAGIA